MIKIIRNEAANCISFEGTNVPAYFNACLSGEVDSVDGSLVNIKNDVRSQGRAEPVYEFSGIHYSEFRDSEGNSFASASEVADYMTSVGNVISSDIGAFDIHVEAAYTGDKKTGSLIYPYTDIQEAVDNASDGQSIFLKGEFTITSEISLPDGKSLYFFGNEETEVKYASYDASNGNIFSHTGSIYDCEFTFQKIKFSNAGGYALLIKKTKTVNIRNCQFVNNGWDGTELNTVLDSTSSGLLGYDSDQADLQAFYAGDSASNGGAARIEECQFPLIRESRAENNLRGFRLQDCGINGGGFVIENRAVQNIESGFYLAAGALGGCQNITVTVNYSAYNANNGLLSVGGINNKFSQNEVNGNWNAGLCGWGSSNLTLRDCGLYNNNRSQFNGIGNTGDAKASIQLNDAASFLATTFTLNPASEFLAEILDTQVHYTGLGSNTERIGLLLTSGMGSIPSDDKNIIKVDDVGFIGQDYAIDFSEVSLDNLRVALGDNSYMSIGEKAVRQPLSGQYFELPFSNHTTSVKEADFSVDNTGGIHIKEGSSGSKFNPYKVNDLQAVAFGSLIRIILKDSNKVQLEVPVSGCSIDGSMVNSVLSIALTQLNDLFTNSSGFSSGGNPVTDFTLDGDNLTLTLQDGSSYTVDVTTLGVDENKFVQSGALNGSNLELTMNDSSIISIDASNMINGSTLPALSNSWFISYGSNAGEEVESAGIVAAIKDQQPFYNGDFLEKGEEYVWTHDDTGGHMLGVYSGVEETKQEQFILDSSNWSSSFAFDKANGIVSHTSSVGVDVATRYASGYGITNSTVFALRYGNDNHLYLLDITDGGETIIGKSNVALVGDSVVISMGGSNQPNAKFPVMVKRFEQWSIAHDFDNSENGEWNDGVETDTIIESNMTLGPGQKMLLNFNYFGRSERIGLGYTGASSGVSNAWTNIEYGLIYNASELLFSADTMAATGGEWTWNQNASKYHDPNGDGSSVGYWNGLGVSLGLVSFVYNADNSLVLYHEGNGEEIATLSTTLDGSDINIYVGFNEAHPTQRIPAISRQDIGAGSQPITTFAPDISDQSFDVTEGTSFNISIALDANSDIVNQYVEQDAPAWAILHQELGNFFGTAPAFTGTAADTYVINCKAGNAVGGITNFTVTLNVVEQVYTNTKSLKFSEGSNSYLGANASVVTSLERASNGSGSADEWTIAFWMKGSDSNTGQTLFYFGANDVVNSGFIELKQTNHNGLKRIRFRYGSNVNHIQLTTPSDSIDPTSWQHVLVSYNGGETGSASGSLADYYSRFKIYIDGALQATSNSHNNNGYSGSIVGENFRFGRFSSGNYLKNGYLNKLSIWNSDQSSNAAALYNSGVSQDELQLVASAGGLDADYETPSHQYQIDDSVSTIQDQVGTAHFVGYNFSSSDLVNDAPPF